MALEPGVQRPSVSPTNSGRVSPVSKKWASRRGEEDAPTKDKAFRRYASGVDRSLSLFDTSLQEWADYIQSLGRLLKSLQAHPSNINVIPSKGIVAKRLAQCLNPTLPSGVHQKALEVYNYIFSMIGKDELSLDLSLYLPGLSSTLSFASLTVREPFLALLETHLLNLEPSALRPALKAIILALLPGLEEDTSEDFERTLHLVDGFKFAVRSRNQVVGGSKLQNGDEYFWQCFFLASITSNNRRLGALAYLTRNLPKLGSPIHRESTASSLNTAVNEEPDVTEQITDVVTSPEPGLLLRCFAAGLADEQLLIQRGFLDLLVSHLPLHARVLQTRVKQEDLEFLLAAACGVVSRRDMSLNRRLWSWLLGPEPSSISYSDGGLESPKSLSGDPLNALSSSRTRYFEEYGLQPLTRAILKMIHRDHLAPSDRSKPFRICLSLMDRWEIGGLVVPEIFLPVVSSVRRYERQATTKTDFNEVLRSASVFFDGVESGLIWGEILGLMAGALKPGKLSYTERVDKLALVRFILGHFNVREEEMVTIHVPTTTLAVLVMIEDFEAAVNEESEEQLDGSPSILEAAMSISIDLIDLIPERAFIPRPSTSQSALQEQQQWQITTENSQVLEKICLFYVQDQGNLDSSPPPFKPSYVCELLIFKAVNITCQRVDSSMSSADIAVTSRLLVALLTKAPRAESLNVDKLLVSLHMKLSEPARQPFSSFTSYINLATTLHRRLYLSEEQFSDLVVPLVRLAWSFLSASNLKYHVETVRALWQLQMSLSFSNREIEAAICVLIMEHDTMGTFASRDADPGRRFSILWTHTLQDNAGHLDRRGSKIKGDATVSTRPSSIRNYEVMLERPLFLLLDSLLDERTQLFVTIRTWLQSLVGIDKLFHLFVAKFSSFDFLQPDRSRNTATLAPKHGHVYSEDHDLDQCLYYLQKLSHILQWSSDVTWAALAQNSISTDMSHGNLFLITGRDGEVTLQEFYVHVCLRVVAGRYDPQQPQLNIRISQLHRMSLAVLHQILLNPYAAPLLELQLEMGLIERLNASLNDPDPFVQVSLLDVVFAALKLRVFAQSQQPIQPQNERRPSTQENSLNRRVSLAIDVAEHPQSTPPPPQSLVKCLQAGFSTSSSRSVLDSWIAFLSECLPFYSETFFQILLPLVETLCAQIGQTFGTLENTFKDAKGTMGVVEAPESTLISLLNGLEQVLAHGHERLLKDEARTPTMKSPDPQQSFFGNMVSGVFASDIPQTRSQTANNRLTVLLSFQDAVRICFTIWSWGGRGPGGATQDPESASSFNYTSLRMRNRARRLLEHLFAAEALECLETVIEIWQKAWTGYNNTSQHVVVFNLLHVLDGSRPKYTMPAIFDAIYSRTNPNALEAARKSILTSSLLDTDLVVFLVEYSRSLEDDAMDEIWTDCMSFLREILANPFPHRQTLPSLLEFAAVLGEKVDNTNFGEQKRMRKELGDVFLRLLTATFTTKPTGFADNTQTTSEKGSESDDHCSQRLLNRSNDLVGILASIAANFPKILVEPDRVSTAANTISMSIIGPTFRSKSFPDNVSKSLLVLLHQLTRLPNTQKSWKKDMADAFNDARFFSTSFTLLESDWIPLLRQWALTDKERMPELLSRISPPTTAGIVFGVGATSARFEADRKTQLNLRRIATLILAAADDTFATEITGINEKIVEILSATITSSPSSTTRAEIYMVFRALILKTSPIHLVPLWPVINTELHASLSSVIAPDHSQSSDTYNNLSILQACKLLDTLLCIAPDDFQLHEWLFITDTIDAVYRPSNYEPIGLIDELSEELGSTAIASAAYMEQITAATGNTDKSVRRPLLGPGGVECDDVGLERKDELVGKVLRPFFSQLSIFAFERTYEMGVTDIAACRSELLKDLFDERGVVKAL